MCCGDKEGDFMEFVAFYLGDINIYWYGLIIVFALLIGLGISKIMFKLYGEKFSPMWDLLIFIIPVSLICARIFYVIIHLDAYMSNIGQIFCIWQGGLSIYGALLGFLATSIVFLRKYGYNLWLWFDLMMPSILFGLIILQLANFMMQFSLGTPLGLDIPNDHSLAEYVEYRYRPTGFEAYQYFQPVALYQAFAYSIVFMISVLCLLINRKYKFLAEGTIFLFSVILMAIIRFGIGFMYFSVNKDMLLYPMQWIALTVMIATVFIYVVKRFQHN